MINYYYVLYFKREGVTEIHARPFPTREEAKDFKEKWDEKFKKKGTYEFSKIMKRDMSKHPDPHWL